MRNWIGKEHIREEQLHLQPCHFMQALLDQDATLETGSELPLLWHWLYFLEARKASALGRDAHPKKGGFLPPVALPRRMWAGGAFSFHAPLIIGKQTKRRSVIEAVTEKTGRSGSLCFVTVKHVLSQNGIICIEETHDIVYREDPKPDQPQPSATLAPTDPDFSEIITPNEAMLFRYSALTFNGHRIHYDVDYAREVEGYDGLVFHAPLTATLMIDAAVRVSGRTPKQYQYRATAPITGMRPFSIEGEKDGGHMTLWAKRHDGVQAMLGHVQF